MRYLALLFAIILCLISPQSASASVRKRAAAAAAHGVTIHRPVATFRERFNDAADHLTAKLLRLLPPALAPDPREEIPDGPVNRLATISLICGVAGYLGFWIALPAALVTGIIALNQIRDSGEGGKSRAVAGIILGGAPIAIAIIVFSWVNGQ